MKLPTNSGTRGATGTHILGGTPEEHLTSTIIAPRYSEKPINDFHTSKYTI